MPDPDNGRHESCDSRVVALVVSMLPATTTHIHASDAYARRELLPIATSAAYLLLIFINFQIGHKPNYLSFILGMFLEPVISYLLLQKSMEDILLK
jgi:hypothetical protein